ncbi:MAG: murein biosynthesis integral membrane protein MurJ, partial [Alphaproteobacteria bacterium]
MSLVRSIFTVGGYTLVSRVLGLVRDLLTAALLGAGPMADAFFVAFRLPNLFRRLFAEGAFAAAFVPMFARTLEADGPEAARRFAEQALSVLVAALIVLTVVAELAMPWLVLVLAPGFADEPEKFALAVEFSRITFPYLLFVAAMALMAGVLNGLYRFGAAAAAPIVLNLCMIVALFTLSDVAGSPGHALSWGVAAAGIGQCLLLMVALRNAGMALRPTLPRITPQIRRLLALIAPGALGAGVMQINLLVGTMIASLLPTGAVAYLYYADRLYQLPLGVIGIAVGTALLPRLSRELRAGELRAAAHTTNRSIEVALLLTLPASAALLVLATPIVSVLFERGAFTAVDTAETARTLAAYAVGLPAFVLVKVLAPAFFAREDTRTPVIVAAWTVAANIVFSVLLVFPFGHVGLALATSAASWINAGWLAIGLSRRGFLAADDRLLRALPRLLLATTVMTALLAAAGWPLADAMHGGSLAGAGLLAGLCAGGAVAFFAAAFAA